MVLKTQRPYALVCAIKFLVEFFQAIWNNPHAITIKTTCSRRPLDILGMCYQIEIAGPIV